MKSLIYFAFTSSLIVFSMGISAYGDSYIRPTTQEPKSQDAEQDLGQSRESRALHDFYVQITARRVVFYSDEYIEFRVMKKADRKLSPSCDFGQSGTLQVLRNGNVIKSFTPGPVSRLGIGAVSGVQYVYYGWGLGPYDFLHNVRPSEEIRIGRHETFQFRATCGDHISAASRPFHISEWREPVDGLQVFVTPLQKRYRVGEPIKVKVTMRNIGTTPKRCPVPFAEDGFLRSFWALKPQWSDERPFVGDELFYERSLKTLKTGESRSAVFDLKGYQARGENKTRSLGAEPGKYLVWFSVFFDDDQVPATYQEYLWRDHELGSNSFEIVIE